MAIDPPYRLDPLQNVVNVKWGFDYVTSTLWINRGPTLEFQQTNFNLQTTDKTVGSGTGTDPPFPPGVTYSRVTQFRWIFQLQAPFVTPPFTGGSWAAIQDNLEAAPMGTALVAASGGEFTEIENDEAVYHFEGLPDLPMTVGADGDFLAAVGTATNSFWPQALWDELVGEPWEDPDSTKTPPFAPFGFNDQPFLAVTTATLRLKAWTIDDSPTEGFSQVPEGGWIHGEEEPAETFNSLEVNLAAIRFWRNGKAWVCVAAALDQLPGPDETGYEFPFPAYSRPVGKMHLLFKRDPGADDTA